MICFERITYLPTFPVLKYTRVTNRVLMLSNLLFKFSQFVIFELYPTNHHIPPTISLTILN
jgi:hypothetical protein